MAELGLASYARFESKWRTGMDPVFDYFQIAVLLLFGLVIAARTLHLRISQHINPITIGAGKKGIGRVIELCFLIGLIVWVAEVLSAALHFGLRFVPVTANARVIDWPPAKLIGTSLVTFAFFIFILALLSFGDSWRVGIDNKAPGELVAGGLFAVSRNPIYVCMILYAAGTFLIDGTLCLLVFSVLLAVALHFRILQEERFLLGRYGQAYQAYCGRTGRYITLRHLSLSAYF
jgi:protein-S-isoprenylcysteine O-methyltransferase Ste14